jgi:hypothetical protein
MYPFMKSREFTQIWVKNFVPAYILSVNPPALFYVVTGIVMEKLRMHYAE